MGYLRPVTIALLTYLALSVIVVTVASAAEVEAGLLYLVSESGAVTFEALGKTGTLTSTAGRLTCAGGKGSGKSAQTEKHVTSGSGSMSLTGCKETLGEINVSCRTEGAGAEEIAVPAQVTLFNALDRVTKKVLEAGIGISVAPTLKLKCGGVAIVEVKGTVLGLLLASSLTADVTTVTMHFINEGELCDGENAFCKKAQEKGNGLLVNFIGTFETATFEAEDSVTMSKMMVVDD